MIQLRDRPVALTSELAQSPGPSPAAASKPTTRAARILLVDDEEDFRETLSLSLGDEGFGVTSFAGGAAALEHLASGEAADVILLGWRMPGINGIEVLREMRERGVTAPVVFVTGLGGDDYEEAALASGAADFIEKSRRLSILVRRLQMILDGQRPLPAPSQRRSDGLFRLGELELRLDSNRAFWRGQTIVLTLTEFRMVARLALTPGQDVSYREIYDIVHGKDFAAGNGSDGYRTNVRTFIKRIRRKFHDSDAEFDCIQNYPRFGYHWITA